MGPRIPGGRGVGIGGILVLLLLSVVFKRDFLSLAGGVGGGGSPVVEQDGPIASTPAEDSLVYFVSFVLDSVQSSWTRVFQQGGQQYQDATLVLFRDGTQSGCGFAESTVGPFYCPADQKVYIDLGFYQELNERFGAPGDFAQAYVLAHEIGHHLQNLLGIERQMREAQQRSPDEANQLSVRLELQADCFAGVWGHEAARQGLLSEGDIDEGIGAAAAVGDDRLQRMATGQVSPESFTHGSSEQRTTWFRQGFDSGDLRACETFR
jgi:predicted metalloprotease